jgi:signal transduction histidine kinase
MARTMDRQEQLRRDLVADVAHELRTPIAVLQAGHEALLDGVTEPTPAELAPLRDEVLRPEVSWACARRRKGDSGPAGTCGACAAATTGR